MPESDYPGRWEHMQMGFRGRVVWTTRGFVGVVLEGKGTWCATRRDFEAKWRLIDALV